MTTQTYPIQGNERFTKVSNTVVSSINVEDALNNAEVLVTRVAKGITATVDPTTLTLATGDYYPVYTRLPTDSKDDGDALVLPAGALVTRVLVGNDKTIEKETERFNPKGAAFNFLLRNDDVTNDQAITASATPADLKPLATSLDVNQVTTFDDLGALLLEVTAVVAGGVAGAMTVEVHYVMPQF